jgi:hypothetical protein
MSADLFHSRRVLLAVTQGLLKTPGSSRFRQPRLVDEKQATRQLFPIWNSMNPVRRNEFERKCHKCYHTATVRGGQKIHETMTATRNTTGGNIVYQGNKHHHSNRGWISHHGFINESTRISAVDGALWPHPTGRRAYSYVSTGQQLGPTGMETIE